MTWRERIAAYHDVYRLVWPLALGMANNAVMQFVDRVFLSNESTASLEAVLPASMLALLFVGFFQSVVAYSGTFVAQYYGAGVEDGCRTSYRAGLFLSAVFGAVLLCLVPLGNLVFDFVGHSPEVLEREKTYYSITVAGGFAMCGMMAASGYFTGRGKTRLVFWVNLLGNVLNILFDYLFIFGFDTGVPGLSLKPCGIAGAAWATIIAQIVQMLALNAIALKETMHMRKARSEEPQCRDGIGQLMVKILRYGIPSGVQSMLNILSFVIFVFLTGKVGDLAFAVSNAAFTVNYLLIAPIEGIAIGAGVLVGQHQGAGDSQGAFQSGNRAIVLGELYVIVATTLVLVFNRELLMMFAGGVPPAEQEAFMSLGFQLFVLMVLWQYCDVADVILSGALKGAGDTRFVMVWMFIMAFPFWMPILFVTYWLHPTMVALWSTMVVYVFVFFVGTWIRWTKGPWRKIRLIA
ncbi:MAG: MATE family efflux transporter [Kiritimatiellae bacterium]|nr:MATE family efflux transporter [Kiritimatiellia bacterium]